MGCVRINLSSSHCMPFLRVIGNEMLSMLDTKGAVAVSGFPVNSTQDLDPTLHFLLDPLSCRYRRASLQIINY